MTVAGVIIAVAAAISAAANLIGVLQRRDTNRHLVAGESQTPRRRRSDQC